MFNFRKLAAVLCFFFTVSGVDATPLTSIVSGRVVDFTAGNFFATCFGNEIRNGDTYQLKITQEFNGSFPDHGFTDLGTSTIEISIGSNSKVFSSVSAQQAWSVLSNGNYQQTLSSFLLGSMQITVANYFMVPEVMDPSNRSASYSFSFPQAYITSFVNVYDDRHAFKEGFFGRGDQVDLNPAQLPGSPLPESGSVSLFALGFGILTLASRRNLQTYKLIVSYVTRHDPYAGSSH